MNEIKAGCVVVTKFCRSSSKEFASYVDYIGRDEAVRTEYSSKYNLYHDYMGNPEKSTGLFTEQEDIKTDQKKKQLKDIFQMAQDKGSLMWQTVISFDNRWLENNGLYDSGLQSLDERRIQNITRSAVRKMLEKEGLQNAVWSAAIHYNTDNIHVHIATVEPEPMREQKLYVQYDTREDEGETVKIPELDANGRPVMKREYKGTFRPGSIETCKREMVNQIINERENNLKINTIIRDSIVKQKREHPLAGDRDLAHRFLDLYRHMPDCNRNMWNYNNPVMHPLKQEIDSISETYIKRYHKVAYQELKERLQIQEQIYQTAYGETGRSYVKTKLDDLYTRMGNAILKEIRQYDREERAGKAGMPDMGQEEKTEPEWKEAEGVINDPLQERNKEECRECMMEERDYHPGENLEGNRMEQNRIKGEEPVPGVINDPFAKEGSVQEQKRPMGKREEGWTGEKIPSGYRTDWNDNFKDARKFIHKIPPDYDKAIQLLEREHMAGNILATYELGDVYQYGRGRPIDTGQAQGYYRQALEGLQYLYKKAGDRADNKKRSYMAYRLGKMYYYGLGTETDYGEARELFEESENGYARYMLGKMACSGQGMEQDHEKAYQYFHEISNSNPYAAYQAASLLEHKKLQHPEQQAQDLYRSALLSFLSMETEDPSDNLEYRIGCMYLNGQGTIQDKTEAEKYLTASSEAGNIYAKNRLAMLWLKEGRTDRLPEIIRSLTEAAEKTGNIWSMYALGNIYASDEYGRQDISQAMEWYSQAEGHGEEFISYRIGKLYMDRESGHFSVEKAVEHMGKAWENGNSMAAYQLGKLYMEEEYGIQDPRKGIHYLEQAAEQGNGQAAYWLGKLYMEEEYGIQDPRKGIHYLEQAAEQGNGQAAYRLGKLYMDRESGHFSVEKALEHMEKAWENGNGMAACQLGKLYMEEEYGIQDIPKAVSYLEQAAEQGNEQAAYRLGSIYRKEEYGMKDDRKAYYWFQQAEKQGNTYASYQLGKIDQEKKQYKKAADHFVRCGDKHALYCLGKLHLEKGTGMYNPRKGIQYMEQSAQEGNPFAELGLGWTYLKGEGVPRDREKAENWFRQAAGHGSEQAGKILEEMEQGMHYYAKQHIRKGLSLQGAVSRMKKGMKSEWERARLEREHAHMVEQGLRE